MLRRMANMETYLRRTYAQKTQQANEEFPFWDYRSRRGAFCSSSSGYSPSNSSCDGSSVSSMSSSRSETGSENTSISDHSDTDSLLSCDPQRMTLQFVTDVHEICAMEELYQPITNWIDPDLHILKITDKSECLDNRVPVLPQCSASIPSMAIMIFLQEDGMVGFERIQSVKRNFEKRPWKFHHSEEVHRGAINPYPYNSQDFYYTSEDLPLWAIRQVHYGKEHVRTVLFVSETHWDAMVQFYKLVLGAESDTTRDDFCLFTVHSHIHFDVQLALKKLKGDTKPRVLESVKLQFRVNDISNIIPLLPNVCRPLSDTRWETVDSDGNIVVIETPCHINNSFSDKSSLSDKSSISERCSFNERASYGHSRRIRTNPAAHRQLRKANSEAIAKPVTNNSQPRLRHKKKATHLEEKLQQIKVDNSEYKNKTISEIREHHVEKVRSEQIEKIKTENTAFKNHTINNIRERFVSLQQEEPVILPNRQILYVNTNKETLESEDIPQTALKGFYV